MLGNPFVLVFIMFGVMVGGIITSIVYASIKQDATVRKIAEALLNDPSFRYSLQNLIVRRVAEEVSRRFRERKEDRDAEVAKVASMILSNLERRRDC